MYSAQNKKLLLEVACKVAGREIEQWNNVVFEKRPGYCARFIRQLFEAVLGLPSHSWEYRAESAKGMAKILYRAEKKAKVGETLEYHDLQPGDLLFWSNGKWGHVALYYGNGITIENTIWGYDHVSAIRFRYLTFKRLKSISLVARLWEEEV